MFGLTREWIENNTSGSTLSLLAIGCALVVGFVIHTLAFWILEKIVKSTRNQWDDLVPIHLKAPARFSMLLLALQFVHPVLDFPKSVMELLAHALGILFIVCGAWLLVRCIYLVRDILLMHFELESTDNIRSRKMQTQVKVLQNVVIAVLLVVASAMVLMTFHGVRQVGVSLLASAGIAGIILGLAAQKTIGNLISGIQLAITQPIRLEDVVIMEGEWGWIEEITLTYVVVRIWDLRRLIVPISYFLERPIQNWTRSATKIMGTVTLHCDPSTRVEFLRSEAERLAHTTPLWDGNVCVLQVVECRAETIEIRLLLSAADSGKIWELRCFMREAMLEFLRCSHPGYLPRKRVELLGDREP